MEKTKKIILKILAKMNKTKMQKFFENLYLLSLHGMGYGESELEKNGEIELLQRLNKEKKDKKIVFDVGANIGDYSKNCLKYLENTEIYAFEPSKKTFNELKKNLRNTKVKIFNFGFGEKKEKKDLFYDKETSGLASLYNRKLEYRKIFFTKKEKIEIETIDSFCKKNSIQRIDLLKIDVEGNEFNVLKGAKKMLKNKKIKGIQFEFGGCDIDSRIFFRDFWEMLHKDYNFYRIIKGGIIPIKKYTESREIFTMINYFLQLK